MANRTCWTCKHFEPSPIRRKGWCRNPLLYSPQQSHLVHQDDLDCGHRLGNYWEPAEPVGAAELRSTDAEEKPEATPLRFMTTEPQLATATTGLVARSTSGSSGGNPLGSSGGSVGGGGRGSSSGAGGSAPSPPGRPGPGRPGGPSGPERSVSYQPEERYWTDYLRIAFPVLGLLLLLGLFWFWATALIDNDDGGNGTTAAGGVPTQEADATATSASGLGNPPLNTVATTPDSESGEPTPAEGEGATKPTRTPRSSDEETPTSEPVGKYNVDDIVVTNSEANLRSEPAIGENVVTTLPEGTELTVTGESVEAEEYVWVPVEDAEGQSGYVAEDLLDPA